MTQQAQGTAEAAEDTETQNAGAGNTDSEILNRYASLTMEKRALQAREKIVTQDLATLEERVTDIFAENGWSSVATAGGTVYLHREVFARLAKDEEGGYDEAHSALNACGLGYMVKGTVNSQSLRAYVREREEYGEEIPPEAARWIIKTEMFRARVKAGPNRSAGGGTQPERQAEAPGWSASTEERPERGAAPAARNRVTTEVETTEQKR